MERLNFIFIRRRHEEFEISGRHAARETGDLGVSVSLSEHEVHRRTFLESVATATLEETRAGRNLHEFDEVQ